MLKNLTKVLTMSLLLVVLVTNSMLAFADTTTWEEEPNMLSGKDQMLATTADGKIYILGGIGAEGRLTEVQAYDPVTKTWVDKADMPTLRYGATVATVDDKIYVIGGNVSYQVSDLVEMYDTKTDTWTTLTNMPTKRWHSKSTVIGRKIYVVGGTGKFSSQVDQVEVYDTETDTWSTIKSCVGAIDKTVVTSTENNIFSVNIELWIADNLNAHVVGRYDFDTDDWVPLTKRLYDQGKDKFYTEGLIADEFIPALGTCHATFDGVIYYLNSQREIISYDANKNTFRKVATSPFQKTDGSSMAIINGKLYIIGGFSYDERKSIDKVMSYSLND